jgi:DNA-directed RNA polymerase specialized sigma subunit
MGTSNSDEKVIQAFENPKFKWRTISGIAKEAGISPEDVKNIIDARANEIIKSSARSDNGEELYTTRQHHRQKSGVLNRIVSSIKNRAE